MNSRYYSCPDSLTRTDTDDDTCIRSAQLLVNLGSQATGVRYPCCVRVVFASCPCGVHPLIWVDSIPIAKPNTSTGHIGNELVDYVSTFQTSGKDAGKLSDHASWKGAN